MTHGLYDARRAEPAGLALAAEEDGSDGATWCPDVEQLACPPVVGLFACSTGVSHNRRSAYGASHLGSAFLAAGATAVVMSPSELLYRPSLELARLLSAELAQGLAPAEALRRARVAAVEQATSKQAALHPLLVRLYGYGFDGVVAPTAVAEAGGAPEGSESEAPEPSPSLVLVSGAGVLGLMLAYGLTRRKRTVA